MVRSFSAISFILAGLVILDSPASANHIIIPDLPGLRTPLPNEGYLAFLSNPITRAFGEEYTGWIDVRHPAMDGTRDLNFGFDRSDRFVNVRTVTVTDNAGVAANPNIRRDFDFSNKVYALAGLSIIHTESGALTLNGAGGTPNVKWPIDQGMQDDQMKALSRSADAATINAWYVQKYDGTMPNGLTSPPNPFGGNMPRNDGMGIADQAQNSTFAHELGHMLLNVGNPGHSADPQNFFFATGSNYAFNDVGKTAGLMTSAQIDTVFSNPGPNNPGFVQKDHHDAAGDRVDWDFVADQSNLEGRANGADNHNGVDSLFWGIGTTVAPLHLGHDHTGLGMFPATPDFVGPSFFVVDVFSLSTRYSDGDVNAAGNLSLRESALDYDLSFLGANGSIVAGIPLFDFIGGWTPTTFADDFLARWASPIPAVGVFVFAHNGDGHDRTVQIDAIIASPVAVPEPSTLILMGIGALCLFQCARKRSVRKWPFQAS